MTTNKSVIGKIVRGKKCGMVTIPIKKVWNESAKDFKVVIVNGSIQLWTVKDDSLVNCLGSIHCSAISDEVSFHSGGKNKTTVFVAPGTEVMQERNLGDGTKVFDITVKEKVKVGAGDSN